MTNHTPTDSYNVIVYNKFDKSQTDEITVGAFSKKEARETARHFISRRKGFANYLIGKAIPNKEVA